MGTWPSVLQKVDSYRGNQAWIALLAGAVLVVILFVIGMLGGKAGSSRVR